MRFAMWCGVLAILIFCGKALPVQAATDQGSMHVSGLVPGPPPTTAPTIVEPDSGRTFDEKNIKVGGGCLPNLIVKVFRNGLFAGSALCQSDSTYSLMIDLVMGKNDLLARQYDTLNQSSPDSDIVTVYHLPSENQPSLPSETPSTPQIDNRGQPLPSGVAQFGLIIDYDATFQGVFAGTPFYLPLQIDGGVPPYAVSIEWGDGNSSVFSRENNQRFTAEHVYEQGGLYVIKIRVSDRNGNEAFVQFVVAVNGRPGNIVVRSLFNAVQFGGWWVTMLLISLTFGFVGLILGFLLARYLFWRKRKREGTK